MNLRSRVALVALISTITLIIGCSSSSDGDSAPLNNDPVVPIQGGVDGGNNGGNNGGDSVREGSTLVSSISVGNLEVNLYSINELRNVDPNAANANDCLGDVQMGDNGILVTHDCNFTVYQAFCADSFPLRDPGGRQCRVTSVASRPTSLEGTTLHSTSLESGALPGDSIGIYDRRSTGGSLFLDPPVGAKYNIYIGLCSFPFPTEIGNIRAGAVIAASPLQFTCYEAVRRGAQ